MTTATYDAIADLYINLAYENGLDLLDGEPLRVRLIESVLSDLATVATAERGERAEYEALHGLAAHARQWQEEALARLAAPSVSGRVPSLIPVSMPPGLRKNIVDEYRLAGFHLGDHAAAEKLRASYVRQIFHRLYRVVKFGPFFAQEKDHIIDLLEMASAWQDDA